MRTKAKRRVSAATVARLRELRRKHGLGEFASGDPFRGRGRKKQSKVRRYAKAISASFHKLGSGLGL